MKQEKKGINVYAVIVINIILLIIAVFAYNYIYNVESTKKTYADDVEAFVNQNKEPMFKIGKIMLYSSAYAIDNSEEGKLQDIDISQFTDIVLYVDNDSENSELTPENTISEIFIDNFKMTSEANVGEKIINYKNPEKIGKYVDLENYKNDGVLFRVLNTNAKNEDAIYDEPVFYTDCSNPITLGYINKNVLTNCAVANTGGSIAFDGSILKGANIDLKSLTTQIVFTVHIKNNYNEEFVCNVTIDNDVNTPEKEIESGYLLKAIDDHDFKFLKVSE